MAGLDYGHSYTRRTPHHNNVGVFYAVYINKWLVRVKGKGKGRGCKLTTLAQFEKESDAIEFYKNYKEI